MNLRRSSRRRVPGAGAHFSWNRLRPTAGLLVLGLVMVGCAEKESAGPSGDLSLEQRRQLKALPYANWTGVDTTAALQSGVVLHDPDQAQPGLNLFNSRPRSRAVLMDMSGNEVHAWQADHPDGWHHIELDRDGNLLVIVKEESLTKLDWDSRILWSVSMRAHHDIALSEDGEIFVLTRGPDELQNGREVLPILEDYIVVLTPEGEVRRRYRISPLLRDLLPEAALELIRREMKEHPETPIEARTAYDLLHTNTLEITPEGMLISMRSLDLVALVDLEREELIWSWGPGEVENQHQPTRTAQDRILVFDNGPRRGYSRILEFDPATGKIHWECSQGPEGRFLSESRGGCQELANGNVLITNSNTGRVFEVTRRGQIVWDYLNPDLQDGQRATIYRLRRIDPSMVAPRL